MPRYRKQEKNERDNRKIQKREILAIKLDKDCQEVEDANGKYTLIDGSSMEGGGQILRNSVSLAALLGKSIKIVNIRAKRDRPGLKAQHLTGIQLVRDMYKGAALTGGTVNSMEISFTSTNRMTGAKEFVADTKTAGSIGLLIQVSLPCIVFGPHDITLQLKGGTNAEAAPQIDYTTRVFKPIAEKHLGFSFDIDIVKRGFYPQGGGVINLKCKPVQAIQPIVLTERGNIVSIYGRSFVSSLPVDIAARMAKEAKNIIRKQLSSEDIKIDFDAVQESKETAVGIGTGIILVATTSNGCLIAGSALGERGKSAEKVGEEAAMNLLSNIQSEGCVDEYLQDQLILFMALAKGKSKLRTGPLTLHTETSIHFAGCLTGAKFTVTPTKEGSTVETYMIECEGIGYQNPHMESEKAEATTTSEEKKESVKSEGMEQ